MNFSNEFQLKNTKEIHTYFETSPFSGDATTTLWQTARFCLLYPPARAETFGGKNSKIRFAITF